MAAAPSSRRPPPHAQTYYKVVAVAAGGRFLSIFDGMTTYALDEVTTPADGCWVCPDLLSLIKKSPSFPSRTALSQDARASLPANQGGTES